MKLQLTFLFVSVVFLNSVLAYTTRSESCPRMESSESTDPSTEDQSNNIYKNDNNIIYDDEPTIAPVDTTSLPTYSRTDRE